jgi:hypothetical protein
MLVLFFLSRIVALRFVDGCFSDEGMNAGGGEMIGG